MLIVCFFVLYSQETNNIKEKSLQIDPYFNLNTWTFDPKITYYAYESGVNIMVYTFNKSHHPFHLHIGLLYKEVGFGLGLPDERYSASHLGFGGGISTDILISDRFSSSLSCEIYRSLQIHTHSAPNVNINRNVRALQNKTGITFYYNFSPKIGFGISGKIAPCLVTTEQSYTGYFVDYDLIDYGWPFYIGSTIRIKL